MSVSTAATGNPSAANNSVTIDVLPGAQVVTLPAGLALGAADFIRHGGDLEIVLPDGRHIVLPGFFDGAASPALATVDGQMLPADLVARLAGPLAPGQFAQAEGGGGPAAGLVQIGMVDKFSGTVTVQHADGTTGTLQQGDPVYQGDIIETKFGGAVGVVLADRSTFALGSAGRMVMDELVYDPNTKDGHANLSVLKGSFSFISGQIAHAAPDAMQVRTPVMTIGVRGTTVAGEVGETGQTSVALVNDIGGGAGQVVVTNSGGTQVLSQPNTMLSVTSSFAPPGNPLSVSPAVIASTFGGAIGSLPVPPTTNALEWNTVPGQNQPAPVQAIQSRPEAGATIQVDSPNGPQVQPSTQQQGTPQQEGGPQEPGAQEGATQEGAAQGQAQEGGAQGQAQEGAAQGQAQEGAAQGQAQEGAAQEGAAQGAAQEGAAQGAAQEGAATGAAAATGAGAAATQAQAQTAAAGGESSAAATGAAANAGTGGAAAGGGASLYSSAPATGGSGPTQVVTISNVVQNSPSSGSSVNPVAAAITGTGGTSAGAASQGGGSSGTAGGAAAAVAQAVQAAATTAPTTTTTTTTPTSTNTTNEPVTTQPTTTTPTTTTVRVVDGPVSGMFVFRDVNGNGAFDVGEASGVTDATGYVTLAGSGGTLYALPAGTRFRDMDGDNVLDAGESFSVPNSDGSVGDPAGSGGTIRELTGGVDTTSGATIRVVLTAYSTSKVVSPLTTLLRQYGGANPNAQDLAAAEVKLVSALGLTAGTSLSADPTSSSALTAAAGRVLAAVSVLTAGLGNGAQTSDSVFEQMVAALMQAAQDNKVADLESPSFYKDVLTGLGVGEPKLSALMDMAAQGAQMSRTSPGELSDFLARDFDQLSDAGFSGDPQDISSLRGSLAAFRDIGVTTHTITAGNATLTPEEADGLTFVIEGDAHVGVAGTAASISAARFSGVSSIEVTDPDGGHVRYDYDLFLANRALTSGVGEVTFGIRMRDGESLLSWSAADVAAITELVVVEDATVVMTALQLGHFSDGQDGHGVEKQPNSQIVVLAQGDLVDVMLHWGDVLVLVGDTALLGSQFQHFAGQIFRWNQAPNAMVSLEEVQGDFSTLDLSMVSTIGAGGELTLALAQYQSLLAHDALDMGSFFLHLNGVSGALGLDAADLNQVSRMILSGDASLTDDQLAVLAGNAATFNKDGHHLTLVGSGVLNVASTALSGFDTLELAGDMAMEMGAYLYFVGHIVRSNAAPDAMISLGWASGDLSGLDLSMVSAISASGALTLSWAQFQTLAADHALDVGTFELSVIDVQGVLDIDTADLALVSRLVLSGSTTLTQAQLSALADNAVTLVRGGYGLTLSAAGAIDIDPAYLGQLNILELTGDAQMRLTQYVHFGEYVTRAASAPDAMITLSEASGDLSGLNLIMVSGIRASGGMTLTRSQFLSLEAGGLDMGNFPLTLKGVSGELGIEVAALGNVKQLILSGDTILTQAQLSALADNAVTLVRGGYGLTLSAAGAIDIDPAYLGQLNILELTGDAQMRLTQYVHFGEYVTRAASAPDAMITLSEASGDLSGLNLIMVSGIRASGGMTLTRSQFLSLEAGGLDMGNFPLTLKGVSGELGIEVAALGNVKQLILSGDTILTQAQLTALSGNSATFSKDGHGLTLVASGVVSIGSGHLSYFDTLELTGDASMSADVYRHFVGHIGWQGSTPAITLTEASGDLGALDLSLVSAVDAGGALTLSRSQFLTLLADDSLNMGTFELSVSGVWGALGIDVADLALVSRLVLSGAARLTQAELAAVVDNGVALVNGGYGLTLAASGTISVDPAYIGHFNALELTGDAQMNLAQYQHFAGSITRAASAPDAMIGLSGASGDLSGLDLSMVSDITASGALTLSRSQFLALGADGLNVGSFGLSVNGVSGALGIAAADLGLVDQVILSGDTSVTQAQLTALAANAATFGKNGNGLTLVAEGTVSVSSTYLAQFNALELAGNAGMGLAVFQHFAGHITRAAAAPSATISLSGASGDLSTMDLSLVSSIGASGNVILAVSVYGRLSAVGALTLNGNHVALAGVSGTLTLGDLQLGAVNKLIFAGDVTLTQSQFSTLAANGAEFLKDGNALRVSASGTLAADPALLGQINVLELTGDLYLTSAQQQALAQASATILKDAGEEIYFASDTDDENILAEAGGSVLFHGNLSDYRIGASGGDLVIADQRQGTVTGFDGTDTIVDGMISSGFSVLFDGNELSIAVDGTTYVDFGGGADTVLAGSGLDVVRLNEGNDVLRLGPGEGQSPINYDGSTFQGGGGVDTIEVSGVVDLRSVGLSGFEKLRVGGASAVVRLGSAQLSGLELDGSAGALAVDAGSATDLRSVTVASGWGNDDYFLLRGNINAAETLYGSLYQDIISVNGGDTASGGGGDDVYVLGLGDSNRLNSALSIIDTAGSDLIDVRVVSENHEMGFAFAGATRAGKNLVIHMEQEFGGGSLVLVDFYNGGTVTTLQTGAESFENLVAGLIGTTADDMIVGTSNNVTAETLVGGGGIDDFFGDGGNDVFIGDGKDTVNYNALTSFNAATGYLLMTGPLSAAGNGSATLFDGTTEWSQVYQGIAEIIGTDGNDVLYGAALGAGNQRFTLHGGRGNDQLFDGGDHTTVAAYDDFYAPLSISVIWDGGEGEYRGTVNGAGYTDTTHDILSFVGTAWGDSFTGSNAAESFVGSGGYDTFSAGGGFDTIAYWDARQGVTVDLSSNRASQDGFGCEDTLYDVEQVIGSKYRDTIIGDSLDNALSGQAGADTLTGGLGRDTFVYDGMGQSTRFGTDPDSGDMVDGVDTITDFGQGLDTIDLRGAAGYAYDGSVDIGAVASLDMALIAAAAAMDDDTIGFFVFDGDGYVYVKGAGTGTVNFDGTLIRLSGVVTAPTFEGPHSLLSAQIPTEGADVLVGFSGNDTFAALGGDDTIFGSTGTDHIEGGDGFDVLDFSELNSGVTVNTVHGVANHSSGTTTFGGIERIVGTDSADTFAGGTGDDQFYGGAGIDTVLYQGGDSGIAVSLSSSSSSGMGNDVLVGIERVVGWLYADTMTGSSGADIFEGNDGDDVLSGLGGQDTLIGGQGADTLTGGASYDLFSYSSPSQSTASALDVITDFGTQGDKLLLNNAAGYTYVPSIALSSPADLADAIAQANAGLSDSQIGFFTYAGSGYLLAKGAGTGAQSYDGFLVQLSGLSEAPHFNGTDRFYTVIVGTENADTLLGNSGENYILGLGGDDILTGRNTLDTLDGGEGGDILYGSGGADILTGGLDQDDFIITMGDSPISSHVTITDFGNGVDRVIFENSEEYTYAIRFDPVSAATLTDAVSAAVVGSPVPGITFFTWNGDGYLIAKGVGETINFNNTLVKLDGVLYAPARSGTAFVSAYVGTNAGEFMDGEVDAPVHLVGLDGADTLDGKGGDDLLTGGDGADTFIIDDDYSGVSIITDFQVSGTADMLNLSMVEYWHNSQAGMIGMAIEAGGMIAPNATVILIDTPLATGQHLDETAILDRINAVGGYSNGNDLLFFFGDGQDSALWYWSDTAIDGIAQGAEVKLVTEIWGVQVSQFTSAHLPGVTLYTAAPTSGNDVLYGSSMSDSIVAGIGDDTVYGNGGNDSLWGTGGLDTLLAGSGNDELHGGVGSDVVSGGGGNDLIDGGEGADTLSGGTGSDIFLYTAIGDGGDIITDFTPGAGGDAIKISLSLGNAGNGRFQHVASGDTVAPEVVVMVYDTAVNDSASGIDVATALSTLSGLVTVSAAVFVLSDGVNSALWYWQNNAMSTFVDSSELTRLATFQGLADGSGFVAGNFLNSDHYAFVAVSNVPTAASDRLAGTSGVDVIDGLEGNDLILGGGGADTLSGGGGADTIEIPAIMAGLTVRGGTGIDTLTLVGENDVTLAGGAGIDLSGFEVFNFKDLAPGQNTLSTVTIAGALLGQSWDQTSLAGGQGIEIVKDSGDWLSLFVDASSYWDLVDLYDHLTLTNVYSLTTDGSTSESSLSARLYGGVMSEYLIGSDHNDHVELGGAIGNSNLGQGQTVDIVLGAGDDMVDVVDEPSKENVVLNGGDGTDTLAFYGQATLGSGSYPSSVREFEEIDLTGSDRPDAIANLSISGGSIAAHVTIRLGAGSTSGFTYALSSWSIDDTLVLHGSSSADVLTGAVGNDTLDGHAGGDQLVGGEGADVLCGNSGSDTLTGGIGADTFLFKSDDNTLAALGTDLITDFLRADGDKLALSVATFSGLGVTGALDQGVNYFASETLETNYGTGAGIIVVGSSSGAGGVSVYYAENLGDTASSYQIATLSSADTSTVGVDDFVKVA